MGMLGVRTCTSLRTAYASVSAAGSGERDQDESLCADGGRAEDAIDPGARIDNDDIEPHEGRRQARVQARAVQRLEGLQWLAPGRTGKEPEALMQ